MGQAFSPGRRRFIQASAAMGGGLLIGLYIPPASRAAQPEAGPKTFAPNAWIRVGADNRVTILVARSEMGQGVVTSLPMLVAEELEVDLAQINIEMAPAAPVYINPMIGAQLTGGSTSVRSAWEPLRQAGAAAREMLIGAAAQTWEVEENECRAEHGAVIHAPTGRRLTYGQLAAKAATLAVPREVLLKEPADFRIIGRPAPRLDTPAKVKGAAVFGIDVRVPGAFTAMVVRPPVFGGKLARVEAGKAKAVPGVRQVFPIESGIAIVADGFWPALRGRQALRVRWEDGPNATLTSARITERFLEASRRPGAVARSEGDAAKAMTGAAKMREAVYQVPYLAHATMEPMTCTAHVREDVCEIWVPTQNQTGVQKVAAAITGLPPEAMKVYTTYLGGGFGRRAEQDFVADAVQISKAVGAPVKVIWMREDDIQHDFYRPATYNWLGAALDGAGNPIAWTHRIVGPSIMSRVMPDRVKNGIDPTSVEGAANIPYAIPNIHVDYVMMDIGIPVGFWRSVGSSQNAFITECFIDELAAAAKADPYEYRRRLLGSAPRHRAVLELAAEKADWGRPLAPGRARGIAVAESFGSVVAEVAEVSVSKEGEVRVHRVVCAADCGMVVNPDTVEAQMEGGIVYGLTAALKGEITIKDGRVEQSNFQDYPLLRLNEMPVVEVHILKSAEPPGGVGEPGTPPIAPAVANAVFAATGKRIRKLPIRTEELRAMS